MTQKTRSEVDAAIEAGIEDNTSNSVTPADVRSVLTDIVDSALWHDEAPSPNPGGGNVDSVNGQSGTVTLVASDVGALSAADGALKAPLASPTFTGTVTLTAATIVGVDKTDVGLSNVDNTTDLGKPISTATQTALDLKADIADEIPFAEATPTEVRQAAGGYLYLTPEGLAAGVTLVDIGEISGSVAVDGDNGPHQLATVTANATITGLVNNPWPVYRCRYLASADVTVTFGSGVSPIGALPQEGDTGYVEIDDGQTFVFDIEQYSDSDDVSYTNVFNMQISPIPTPTAPAIITSSITPAIGAVGTPFEALHGVTGTPTSTMTYAWYLNDVAIGGATAKTYTPTTGQDGTFSCLITATNGVGSPATSTPTARVGPPIPTFVGETTLHDTTGVATGYDFTLPVGTEEADGFFWYAIQPSTTTDAPIPTGFVTVGGGQIARTSSTAGANYRLQCAQGTASAGNISDGELAAITIRQYGQGSLVTLRGLDTIDWLNTGYARNDTANPSIVAENAVHSRTLPSKTATSPGLAIAIVSGGSYNTGAQDAALTGWTAGGTVADYAVNGAAKYGHRIFYKKVSSGAIASGTITTDGVGDKTLTVTIAVCYGTPDP